MELRDVLNWGIFNVELRGFWYGTEGSVLNWGVFGVELRDFGGGKGMAFLCGTDVLNWGDVELRATLQKDASKPFDDYNLIF